MTEVNPGNDDIAQDLGLGNGAESGGDVPGHRGDEGLLEGVVIKETDELPLEFDDDEDDDGIIIYSSGSQASASKKPQTDKGGRPYVRPHFTTLATARTVSNPAPELTPAETAARKVINEEMKKFRFAGSRTAFDVDIDALEEHPWRTKGADISDYFNYGFNEKTWQKYCEDQLRLRAKMGLGPVQHPVMVRPTIPQLPTGPVPSTQTATETATNIPAVMSQTVFPPPPAIEPPSIPSHPIPFNMSMTAPLPHPPLPPPPRGAPPPPVGAPPSYAPSSAPGPPQGMPPPIPFGQPNMMMGVPYPGQQYGARPPAPFPMGGGYDGMGMNANFMQMAGGNRQWQPGYDSMASSHNNWSDDRGHSSRDKKDDLSTDRDRSSYRGEDEHRNRERDRDRYADKSRDFEGNRGDKKPRDRTEGDKHNRNDRPSESDSRDGGRDYSRRSDRDSNRGESRDKDRDKDRVRHRDDRDDRDRTRDRSSKDDKPIRDAGERDRDIKTKDKDRGRGSSDKDYRVRDNTRDADREDDHDRKRRK